MTPDYVIVLTTLPADADGVEFGRSLVDERLAACVNLLPLMDSVYRWEGRVERETERQVLIKTARERVPALWDRVRELHPYEVPEFVVLSIVDGNEAYLRWVGAEPHREELYDLRADPLQERDLAAVPEHAETLGRLRGRSFGRRSCGLFLTGLARLPRLRGLLGRRFLRHRPRAHGQRDPNFQHAGALRDGRLQRK